MLEIYYATAALGFLLTAFGFLVYYVSFEKAKAKNNTTTLDYMKVFETSKVQHLEKIKDYLCVQNTHLSQIISAIREPKLDDLDYLQKRVLKLADDLDQYKISLEARIDERVATQTSFMKNNGQELRDVLDKIKEVNVWVEQLKKLPVDPNSGIGSLLDLYRRYQNMASSKF